MLALREILLLSGSELFDAKLQDRLGYALLLRCGWAGVADGLCSRDAFALSVAREWAAIPVLEDLQGRTKWVRRGQSFYAGDGRNAAIVTPAAFERAFDEALCTPTPMNLFRRWTSGTRQTS